jgi:hypothetical protein
LNCIITRVTSPGFILTVSFPAELVRVRRPRWRPKTVAPCKASAVGFSPISAYQWKTASYSPPVSLCLTGRAASRRWSSSPPTAASCHGRRPDRQQLDRRAAGVHRPGYSCAGQPQQIFMESR